jgi:tRNA 5-methylaminomethyl-2-thiouridine biosynthesis bifunctional protein
MKIEPAALTWNDQGAPYNTRFNDIYFSADGAREVARVFMEPAGIDARLRNSARMTIAELGFGSGLNFVTLAAAAIKAGCRLHFMSVELHPFRKADLKQTRARYSDDTELSILDDLTSDYPALLPGWHRRLLGNGWITLSIYFGEVSVFAEELRSRHLHGVDAWLLDGFAPDRNPDMWNDSLFEAMARCSRTGATVTTFTSVGRVRRGLETAGFTMRRVDQRPMKRESLAGLWTGKRDAPAIPECVQVFGGGIAGCSLAAHLATQGIGVRLVEPRSALATGASQMCAVQHARLLPDGSPLADWRVSSHLYSLAFTHGHEGVHSIGALQLPGPNLDIDRLERTFACYGDSGDWLQWCDTEEVTRLAGVLSARSAAGLLFVGAPVVELDRLCRSLTTHPAIDVNLDGELDPTLPTVWACAQGYSEITALQSLPTHTLWGQTDRVSMTDPPALAIIGDGYLAPCRDVVMVGSTFEYSAWEPQLATTTNIARLLGQPHAWLGRQRAARLTAPDRMPIIGPIGTDWITTAHGSMGATSAHMAAAVIQSQIMGWLPPLDTKVIRTIDPGRFAARAARRLRHR